MPKFLPRDIRKLPREHELTVAAQKPQRMQIVALTDPPVELAIQYNPESLDEVLAVDWGKLKVPGLSHQVLQYSGTESLQYSFELVFDALADENMPVEKILGARNLLHAMCYSRSGAKSVRDGEAVRALFIWPGLLSLTCVITRLQFKYTRFALDGRPTYFTCQVQMSEIRDVRLTFEDVNTVGTQRAGNDNGVPVVVKDPRSIG